jgi:uncharacterized membrane protein YbaN (DUF454 family)
MRRLVFRVLGLLCVAIGIAGIFLPLVPATDFFLIALWFFARSSQKLHDWLVNHRIFGKYVHDLWVRGGMTRKSKAYSLAAMSLAIATTAATVPLWIHKIPYWVMWSILFAAWVIATVYIASRKTLDPLPARDPRIEGESP